MLNQFYKFIAGEIVSYLKNSSFKDASRFNISLEQEEDVENLYKALKEENSSVFEYKNTKDDYKSITLNINDKKVIVAATIDGITTNYFTKLRNLVKKGQDLQNYSIIFISHKSLDSLNTGSASLQSEGMPLNPKLLREKLNKKIKKSELDVKDKKILDFIMKKKSEEIYSQGYSIEDFSEIIYILEEGEITKEGLKNLGLFPHKGVTNLPSTEMKKELERNYEVFRDVYNSHIYANTEDTLEKLFNEDGKKVLKKKDWYNNDFSNIENWMSKKSTLEFIELSCKSQVDYWDPTNDGETSAKRRNMNIVVFNTGKNESIEFDIIFNEMLSTGELAVSGDCTANINRKKINVKLSYKEAESCFTKIKYTKSKIKYEFKFLIVDFHEYLISNLKTRFRIKYKNKNSKLSFITDADEIILNDKNGENISLSHENQIISVNDSSVVLDIEEYTKNFYGESINVSLEVNNTILPIEIIKDKKDITYINGFDVWKDKRENRLSFEVKDDLRLIYRGKEFFIKDEYRQSILREKFIVEHNVMFAYGIDDFCSVDLQIPSNVKESYFKIIEYFKQNKLLPSTAYIGKKLKILYEDYINEYFNEINKIQENSYIDSDDILELMKLGIWQDSNKQGSILFTPLHPINVSYQLELYNVLNNEHIPKEVLSLLNNTNLIPYIYNNYGQLYKSIEQCHSPEWTVYEKNNLTNTSEAKPFVDKLVKEKIHEYLKHFSYLFKHACNSTLKIKLINLAESRDILKGIIDFYKGKVNSNYHVDDIPNIEVTIYDKHGSKNIFEEFCLLDSWDELELKLDLNLKLKNMSKADFLRILRSKVRFYSKDIDREDFEYSHITFFEMENEDDEGTGEMDCIPTGLSLGGLLSGIPSTFLGGYYKTGFGTKFLGDKTNLLINLAQKYNSIYKAINKGDSFDSNKSIVTLIRRECSDKLESIYNTSSWVTFIKPYVDLNFFKNNKSAKDLLIIHYSDQYTTTSGYDAITVTKKSEQYQHVIEEYLEEKGVQNPKQFSDKIINMFNAVNGDWLLRMISASDKDHKGREKISILSAIKTSLAYFDNDNIIWLPMSMEEIYRVSGGAGLNKEESILSSKNLNVKGNLSDDILLVGIEINSNEDIKVHYYPVEVKIGKNDKSKISKGVNQSLKSKQILISKLVENEEDLEPGKKRIYRNFLMQMALVSAEKFKLYDILDNYYDKILENESIKSKLLNDEYEISDELIKTMGLGTVISFKANNEFPNIYDKQGVLILEFSEFDGYNNLVKDIDDIKYNFREYSKYKLDATEYLNDKNENENIEVFVNEVDENTEEIAQDIDETQEEYNNELEVINEIYDDLEHSKDKKLEDIRILLGKDINTGKDYYWEFGNKNLNNRHMLISGTSGSGKTYCIQALMMEMAKNGISCIVFDYTEGFTEEHLQDKFKNFLGNRLKEREVKWDKFPINPFQKKVQIRKNVPREESDIDVADRLSSVFKSVYKFGDQQKSRIYNAIKNGFKKFGSDMNFEYMRDELSEMNDSTADTVLSKIEPFLDQSPFESKDAFTWKDIIDEDSQIYVIQLSGYNKEMQVLLTELILWDIINYCIKFGSEDNPVPIILDEAQNLDHNQSSPSGFILSEGRKFGISAWYATQYLKGALSDEEIGKLQLAEQKLYFNPPEKSAGEIGKYIDVNPIKSKEWAERVKKLNKGQCVTCGSTIHNNNEFSKYEPRTIKISSLEDRTYNI